MPENSSEEANIRSGVPAAIGAAMLFGLSTPLAKLLVGSVSPLLLSGLLYLGSGLGLAVLLLVRGARGRRAGITFPRGTEVLWLLGAIAAGGVLGPYLQMFGLARTDAATASLILNLEGVFTALLAWVVFNENFDRRIALGMALILGGGVLLALGGPLSATSLIGPLAIAGACLAWGLDNNLTRKVAVNDAMFIACTKGLVAGCVSVGLALLGGAQLPGIDIVLAAGALGFFGYGLSLMLFVLALRNLGTARTGAYFSLAPFAGAAFALLLGAPMTLALGMAGVLMAIGVWLHLSEDHSHTHVHPDLAHMHPHTHDAHHQHAHPAGWDGEEPHSHEHEHLPLEHAHAHYPDIHHRHAH